MRNWWDILDVTQDADLRAVKRAYAGKLKTIRQDEDPAGFMELREAYEHGRANAQYLANVAAEEVWDTEQEQQSDNDGAEQITVSILDDNTDIISDDEADVDSDMSHHEGTADRVPEVFPTDVEQLMTEVKKLVASPWGGASAAQWNTFLDDNRLDDIDVYADFEVSLLNYLLNVHGYFEDDESVPRKISADVGKVIFTRFGWHKKHHSVFVDPSAFQWLAAKLILQPAVRKLDNNTLPKTDKETQKHNVRFFKVEKFDFHPMKTLLLILFVFVAISVLVGLALYNI